MGFSEDEKHDSGLSPTEELHHLEFEAKQIDTAAEVLAAADYGELDPTEARRIRKKIDIHLLPLMCSKIQYMDKTTLGSSAILGIRSDSLPHPSMLGTIFYLSYLVCEYPQNLCLQRFPVGKWMSINIFVWGTTLCCHAACKNFTGLFIVRCILGACEGAITAGFLIVTSMFYTRTEQTVRVGYWFLMNGTAQIISGFISYGSLHIQTKGFQPWQWMTRADRLMIICGTLTLICAILFWFLFPDSPTNAWFLTMRERALAIKRIKKENQTGVENKHFKKEQMIEALTDPKTWLFAFFSAISNVPNSLTNQRQIIVNSFGFTVLQTTLLGCVDGVIEILTIWTGVHLIARIPNSRGYIGAIYVLPNILGAILINVLPWGDKVGLLFSQWLTGIGTTGFVIALSWAATVTAGHTKKITTNAIMLCAYCVGNATAPFMWQEKYKPRNHVPWIIIGICYTVGAFVLLFIRFHLARENKRRDEEPYDDTYDDVWIERVNGKGETERVRVEKEYLDLTDIQNRDFRYVL
ncbi:MFS general substrate transporter [Marasmius fiardii PR-910]|nr:MFS general substrate transporter [Marasmius fiardii PR-910]